MYSKVPVFKPYCFCLSPRSDLITWGCFKLIITALLMLYFTLTIVEMIAVIIALENMYYIDDVVIFTVILGVLSTDFVVHIIFIVGTYKKNLKFFRMYYLYTVCVLVLTVLQGFVCFEILLKKRFDSFTTLLPLLLFAAVSTFFVYLLIQIYVFVLVRREIVKLKTPVPGRFETKVTVKVEDLHEEEISSTDDNNKEQDMYDSNDITTYSKVNDIGVQS
ncbi:unnamed protein product [Arctia plantaginis]|uniref:Uncharacterized protein n=1 Tax=Arctia plantaginis TaxID=874455 RepID=A0A8S0Z6P1_ARCPL|nr:unnamed protein product [Arctia plantaginis]CAB3228294.1 unnamed protein product [Arctia plantaginis]